MQLLQTPPPKLDHADPQVNFAKVQQYLQTTMETVDFILAKYAGSLKAVDADSVARKLQQLEARLVTLDRALTGVKNVQNTHTGQLDALDRALTGVKNVQNTHTGQLDALEQGAESAQTTLAAHETRLKQLEKPGGEP